MFENGNKRVLRLVIWELAAGCILMAIMQVQGMIPSQDWITPAAAKKLCFFLAMAGTLIKALEMFFSKTVTLFRDHEATTDGSAAVTTTTTTETAIKPGP